MSADGWPWTWDIAGKEKTAAKIITRVLDDLVMAEQGRSCLWRGEQKRERNFYTSALLPACLVGQNSSCGVKWGNSPKL